MSLGTFWLGATAICSAVLLLIALIARKNYPKKKVILLSMVATVIPLTLFFGLQYLYSYLAKTGNDNIYFYLPFPLTILFIFILSALVINQFAKRLLLANNKIRNFLVPITTITTVLGMASIVASFFILYSLETPCMNVLRFSHAHVHAFNQHIKDLCYLREDTSECPTSEQELMAFNSQAYKDIQACAKTNYFFNEETQNYTWRIEPYLNRIGDQRNYPEFSVHEQVYLEELQ